NDGSDTYYFERGWGKDYIANFDENINSRDVILFGPDIGANDIELGRSGDDLLIYCKQTSDQITVSGFYAPWREAYTNIDAIQFADGTVWTSDSIRQMNVPYKGTDGDDFISSGSSGDGHFIGGAGNDYIYGGSGNDTYFFERGWGQDTVSEIDGQDKFVFGDGIAADQLWFSYEDESLIVRLIGTEDRIKIDYWLSPYYDDTRIEQFVTRDGKILSHKQVDALVQAMSKLTPPAMGQTSLTPEQLAALASALASCWRNPSVDNAAPIVSGSIGNQKREQDKFFSLVLPENLFTDPDGDALTYHVTLADGSALPSWLTFDAATRTLSGTPTSGDVGSFNFKITATDLYGLSTSQNVLFEVTAAVTNQNITGTNGNDTLQGGAGNDTLQGGLGDDTYIYSGGIDTIIETGGKDTLVFGNGIQFSQVGNYLTKSGNDLILKVNGSATNQVILKNFFTDAKRIIETIRFETGGSISAQQIFDVFGLTMPVDNGGGTTDPTDPTDPGEPGFNTNFVATTGDDNYLYTSGSQTINELGGTDTLTFGNGITFSQVGSYLTKSSNDLILKVGGSTTNQVRIKNFFLGGKYLLENISFETGGNLTAQQIFGAFGLPMPQVEEPSFDQTMTGTSGNDTNLSGTAGKDLIKGLAGNDNLYGQAGNDQLEGGDGNDRLEGGAGNDLLMGGTGDDTYVFARGFGQDVIDNTGGGNDTIYFDGISFNEVGSGLTKSGDDLILKVSGTSDQVTIKDWFTGGENVVQTIQFSTGGSISANQIFGAFGLSNPNPMVARSVNSLISAMAAFGSDSGAAGTTQSNALNDPNAQQLLYVASLG
ncbi:MAG: calcium-binding protein, partial [Saezia sp.]